MKDSIIVITTTNMVKAVATNKGRRFWTGLSKLNRFPLQVATAFQTWYTQRTKSCERGIHMSDTSFFKNHTIKISVDNVDQQLRRYLTACENEKATYRIVEDAISERLIPIVENMMSDDAMEGGVHPMKHHTYQGQPALFCSHSCYVANYTFARGFVYDELKKIGDLPFYDAGNMIDEGNRLLDMIDDLEQGMKYESFNKKYYRVPKLKGVDRLLSGIERMVDDAIKNDFHWSKVSDVMPFYNTATGECGMFVDLQPDKRITDYTMFPFLSQNRQALGVGVPALKNDMLYMNGSNPVQRYNLHLFFTLTNPLKNKEEFELKYAKFDFVRKDVPISGIYMLDNFVGTVVDVNLSAVNTKEFASKLLNDKIFHQKYATLGSEEIGKYFVREYEAGIKALTSNEKVIQSEVER